MKKNIILFVMMFLSIGALAQENIITLSGGYSFAKIEDTDITGTGYRINGLYEFNSMNGALAHGLSFGYIGLTADVTEDLRSVTYKINSFPIYYAPKVMFGKENFKFFVKGALGMQFASFKKTGSLIELEDNDAGFYGGGGAGFRIGLGEMFFINAEYEIAWASNSWYKDGWMNTAMGGIGIRF
jgi:hypothetical protein